MPKKDHILNLPGYSILKVHKFNPVVMDVVYRLKVRCPHCDSKKLRKKDSYQRRVKHETIGLRKVILNIQAHKFLCRSCGRYFNQRLPGILPYKRVTEKLRKQVFHLHTEGLSQHTLSQDLDTGKSTIERWYHDYYERNLKNIEYRHCPRVLGIDEHSFNRKTGYATTLCDLSKHKIFDVVRGGSEATLKEYLMKLRGRHRVKVVCIDLSSTYRSIVKKYFPNAMIVADRFHVIRLIGHHILQTYRQIDNTTKYKRGILNALKKKPENLTPIQQDQLAAYFKQHPAIKIIYDFKQELHFLMMNKHRKARQCVPLISAFLDMVKQLKGCAFESLKTLGKTLYKWRDEVVRMWLFTKNNALRKASIAR